MKTSSVVVRPAAESDFSEIVRIVEEISVKAPEKKAQFNWDRFQIRDELIKANTWVAADSHSVKSFLCCRETPDFLEITVLATAIADRKLGYQSALVKALLNEGRLKHKKVLLEVHEENLSAIKFYRKHGFVELPSRKNYYSDGKSALVFVFGI